MTILLLTFVLMLLVAVFVTMRYSLLIPAKRGLPVLMYHHVLPGNGDWLTVTPAQLENHLQFLKQEGYQTMTFSMLMKFHSQKLPLPPRTVILTFDDAYVNFREHALPLLKKYGFTATVFVPVALIGKTNDWDKGHEPIMTAEELKHLTQTDGIEAGLHSFMHQNYGEMTPEEVRTDLVKCYEMLGYQNIPFSKVLAYPYGGYPKKDPVLKEKMFSVFRESGLDFALRIGNDVNRWPLPNPFEIKRIDIRGTDSFFIFKTKVRKGRARLFS